jgi:photosystem II stability/assembly factor-like uncharacterized protein
MNIPTGQPRPARAADGEFAFTSPVEGNFILYNGKNFSKQKKSVKTKIQNLFIALVISAGINHAFAQGGLSWMERDVIGAYDWTSVASSADGTKLVAVGNNGPIYTSTDSGVTWTAQNSVTADWTSVASSADGTKLVVVDSMDTYQAIYTSTDSGITWTPRNGTRYFNCVASSADGAKLVARDRTGQIYTSTDSGVTWMAQTNSGALLWNSVASSADGTKLVAAGNGDGIYTSTDSGVTWVARSDIGVWTSIASSADGTKLAAGNGNGFIYTSTDSGVTWTVQTNVSGWYWNSIASSADGTKLVAAAAGGPIYTSTDSGVTWTAQTIANSGNQQWTSVASSADGTKLVAVQQGQYGGTGRIYISVPTLTITHVGNNLTISWPYPSTGWTLQQNSDLTTAIWSTSGGVSNDGTNNFITVTAPTGNLFFRLEN